MATPQALETQTSPEMQGAEAVLNLGHLHFYSLREEGAAAYALDPTSELFLPHAWMLGYAESLGKD